MILLEKMEIDSMLLSRIFGTASESALLAAGAELHGAVLLLNEAEGRGDYQSAVAAAHSVGETVGKISMSQAQSPTGALIQARALDTLIDHIEDPELHARARRLLQSLTIYLEENAGVSHDDWGGSLGVD